MAKKIFSWMAKYPLPFMIVWPIVCIVVIALGWGTISNIVNDDVSQQWIPQRGAYAENLQYGKQVGTWNNGLGATTIAAMAIARDGRNLFTADRLELIRARMEATERIHITYNNETYRWEDVCYSAAGFPYRMPCARLSPLDFFQEARWFFNHPNETFRRTWYDELLQKQLVEPRLPRFAVLMQQCVPSTRACQVLVQERLANNESFVLLKDAGGLDYSDPCRICIEEEYEALINEWTEYIPTTLAKLASATPNATLAANLQQLADTITINDIVEFHYYYSVRFVYGTLGAPELLRLYSGLARWVGLCVQYGTLVGLTCPPANVTLEMATMYLWSHADADFSSVNTAGLPLPLWDKEDGTGTLFKGVSPVGGSGIEMSGKWTSIDDYLAKVSTSENATVDPMSSSEWMDTVEKNPFYAWFMGSITNAPADTKCGTGNIPGTALTLEPNVQLLGNTSFPNPFEANTTIPLKDLAQRIDDLTFELIQNNTQSWCNKFTIPNENTTNTGTINYSKQHFARMWFDLLVASEAFLDIQEGLDDPYTWTISEGCGYTLRGERESYTGKDELSILKIASGDLYYIDEGAIFGVVDPNLLIGGATPPVREASPTNPLQKASVLQTIYPALKPRSIRERVANCNRPGGAINITMEDAEEILFMWKKAMEEKWSEGWDDENSSREIQFVAFADDAGINGSTGRMLREITLSNTLLTIISIVTIALFSIFFMLSTNLVESRVVVTLVGVALVVLSYFAAVGFGLLIGIKIQITIAWTLPFIILGLGVDDMYIVLHTLRQQDGYSELHYMKAMEEVLIPVTMTSVVNAAMFAVLTISDIAAIYDSARIALFAVVSLYIAIIFCFPAYCYVDMKRQAQNKKDLFLGTKTATTAEGEQPSQPTNDVLEKNSDWRDRVLYDKLYLPLVLGSETAHRTTYFIIWLITAALLGASTYGLTQVTVGLGLEEFFPKDNPAFVWATTRTQELASWNIVMRWGAISYEDPLTQMKMIQQFEHVTESSKVSQTDTDQLWMASFLIWSSRLCDSNLVRSDFGQKQCGRDMRFTDGTLCAATWTKNTLGLRNLITAEPDDPKCHIYDGGICRTGNKMHIGDLEELQIDPILSQDQSYCPVIKGWSAEKWQFCLKAWRTVTGYDAGFVLKQEKGSPKECSGEFESDQDIVWPIPISNGPTMYAYDLFSHEDTLDLIKETRAFCDDDTETHCWLTGIPYDYWTQYADIYNTLLRLGGYSCAVGFLISYSFLFFSIMFQGRYGFLKACVSSLFGSLLIFLTIALSFLVVVGLSLCVGVSLTGFSNMAFVLSVGFSVEYSVHIVSRWMRCDARITSGIERVRYAMSFLTLPLFMSFVSSAIGVCCLAFTAFDFNETYFFRPLILVMFVTYFFGCFWLPSLLVLLEADVFRLGSLPQTPNVSLSNAPSPDTETAI